MGMFSDMFSVKSIDSMVDAVIDTGDALVFTEEEKAATQQLKRDTKIKMLELYKPYKLAQRLIAVMFTANFLLAFWVSILLFMTMPTYFDGFISIVDSFNIGWIMLAIISFYFTDGAMSWYKGKKNG